MPDVMKSELVDESTHGLTGNPSRNHPDYGRSPAEHARRKAERLV